MRIHVKIKLQFVWNKYIATILQQVWLWLYKAIVAIPFLLLVFQPFPSFTQSTLWFHYTLVIGLVKSDSESRNTLTKILFQTRNLYYITIHYSSLWDVKSRPYGTVDTPDRICWGRIEMTSIWSSPDRIFGGLDPLWHQTIADHLSEVGSAQMDQFRIVWCVFPLGIRTVLF